MQYMKCGSLWARWKRALGLGFIVLIGAASLQAQQKFGYVLDVKGDWIVNGNGAAKLYKGSSLSVGSVITAANPSDSSGYIVLADRSGNVFDKRSCNAGGCGNAIRLPATIGGQQSMASRLLGAAMALVYHEPSKYASFVSRGADLQEAVVKLNGRKLDLNQVFKNMPADRYLVRFEKIGKEKKDTGALKPLPFTWGAKKPAMLNAGDLSPGLYRVSILEVSLLEPDGGNEPTGNEAWVLVTTPNNFAKAAPSFDAALNVTRQWGASVKQNAVRQFLRASLEFLTTQSTR
jgi:hypothetical protein